MTTTNYQNEFDPHGIGWFMLIALIVVIICALAVRCTVEPQPVTICDRDTCLIINGTDTFKIVRR